ncbi:MAG: hypothetical protein ACKVJK_07035 [Methylophagaceae bacterium]|jgi:hypothetical protein|tara:strand:+ start:1426 stop:1734 length:309 start_codon:yes stop_codon:yes gene_type:complete
MLLREFISIPETEDTDLDEKQIWARSGNNVVRKYRCSGGKRHGRIVAKMAQCFAAPNMKKRMAMKKLRAKLGARMVRKARKTKRTNRASKAVQRLNKMSRRR